MELFMLYGFLITLFVFVCLFLILIILIQKSKGSIGIGGLGGGSQLLFGGSGGQDMFQKITWALGAIFMFGSLILALMRNAGSESSRYLNKTTAPQVAQTQGATEAPTMPTETPAQQPEDTQEAPANN